MKYTSRGLRRRRNTNKWEVILSHHDPLSGEIVTTYHTIEAKTKRQAEKARDELIIDLEVKGGASGSATTVREYLESFVDYKEKSGTVEPRTVKSYRGEARQVSRYLGDIRLCDLTIADVSKWMADMTAQGYAPKSVEKPFRLLKQALKFAIAQDYLTKNPCDFCKPPKRVKPKINALGREERTRMLELAVRAEAEAPLGMAIELALTTGMRRGEVCALRWSDLGDDGTITVRRALGNADGGYYVKEPKTGRSRTIPLTEHTFAMLSAMKKDTELLLRRLKLPDADPYILGTQKPESRYYNPTQLGKDFAAFCKMNGFRCTFHDLRHTFATMMIAGGTDVRTVASYLGHANVSMTLDTYADVDPDAKKAAVAKVAKAFDVDMSFPTDSPARDDDAGAARNAELMFTVEQLRAMLAEAERREAGHAGA